MIDINKLVKIATALDEKGLHAEADELMEGIEEVMVATAAAKEKKIYVFSKTNKKINDDKDHIDISNEKKARSALKGVLNYKDAPPWFDGDLKAMINTITKMVRNEYPKIDVSEILKMPSKK